MTTEELKNKIDKVVNNISKLVKKRQKLQCELLVAELELEPTIKEYSYILFKDEYDGNAIKIGFNRHNDPGYIDDSIRDEDAEVWIKLIELIPGYECNSCTYEFSNNKDVKKTCRLLESLGIKPMTPGDW